ncbi:MAG TPA: SH3 domain-containing protein [Anaerolineales bacterium]|nr:SH3 domain-containing protein [Anaerolineales bacterium]
MKSPRIISVLAVLAILASACNLPSTSPQNTGPQTKPPVSGPTDTSAPAAVPPTDTPAPLPTDTATIAPTDTPASPMVTPKTDAVNCRFGPGTSYVGIGGLMAGATVPILGQNGDGTWWQITNPNNITTQCWVAGSATDATGNLGSVPVVPAPTPFVTKVTAIPPAAISVPGCMGPIAPISLTGTIETNGPVSVTWHFETQQGGVLSSHTLNFTKYGPQNVTDHSFTPPLTAGTYWVRLVITTPNSVKSIDVTYTITC